MKILPAGSCFNVRWFWTVLVVVAGLGCTPESESGACPEYYSDAFESPGVYDYFFHVTGNQWVYKEESSGDLDTLKVFNHQVYNEDPDGIEFEWFAHSSYFNLDYHLAFERALDYWCNFEDRCRCHRIQVCRFAPGNFVGCTDAFTWPFVPGDSRPTNAATFDYQPYSISEALFDSLTISDMTFHNVAKVRLTGDLSWDGDSMLYYLAPQYGIIRYRNLTTGQHWNLIDYD